MAEGNELSGLKLPTVWRSVAGDVPFPTDPALDWYLRKYKKELKQVGALVQINRRNYIVPRKFELMVLQIAQAEVEHTT